MHYYCTTCKMNGFRTRHWARSLQIFTNTKLLVNNKLCSLLNVLINCCYISEQNLPPIEPDNTAEAVIVYALTSYVGNERRLKWDLTLISHGVLTVERTFYRQQGPEVVSTLSSLESNSLFWQACCTFRFVFLPLNLELIIKTNQNHWPFSLFKENTKI